MKKNNRRLTLLTAILLFGLAVAAQQTDPLVRMSEKIEESAARLGGNVVAVAPFTYADGIKSIEGAIVSERLVVVLTERGFVKVAERQLLDKVMEEQKLGASGLVDAKGAARIGKLLGARGIVTGTATDEGEHLEVRMRVVNVETAEVVAAVSETMPRALKTFISPLWSEISRIKKQTPSFNVRFWADKGQEATATPRYRIGDTVTLFFEAEEDCYVTIFDFTTSGSIHVLFPNAYMRANNVKGGRTYAVPGAQSGFKIRVSDPPGIEKLKLFAATKDIPLFRQDYSQESFRSLSPDNYTVTRDLLPAIDSLEDNAWAESQLELRIEQVLRSEP